MQAALLSGIVLVLVCGYRNIRGRLAEGSRTAVGGAILAAMNTASEYGFGAVIAALPGFLVLSKALAAIPNPLLNEAIAASRCWPGSLARPPGMSIAPAAMSETFVAAAHAANIPLEVLHRVAAHGQRRHGHPAAQRGGDHPCWRSPAWAIARPTAAFSPSR